LIFKNSFIRYLKSLFIIGEIIFMSILFLAASAYVGHREENAFLPKANGIIRGTDLYAWARLRLDDQITYLDSYVRGDVTREELYFRIRISNQNIFSASTHINLGGGIFFPELPEDLLDIVDPLETYRDYVYVSPEHYYVIGSYVNSDASLVIIYKIAEDEILKKNIMAANINGLRVDQKDETWFTPRTMSQIQLKTMESLNLEDYKIGFKPKLVFIPTGLGLDGLKYILTDAENVNRANRERFILGIAFILKVILTILFTLWITNKFSKALKRLVEDSKKLSIFGDKRSIRGKDYRFKEFQTIVKTFSSLMDGRDEVEEKLRITNLNMEDTIKSRTQDLSKAIVKGEEASRAKMNFLAQISHEIRTPMNCIIGFCEIIQEKNPEGEVNKFTEKIIEESEILLKLINDILDDSKIDSGKMHLETNSVDIRGLINRIIELGNPYDTEHNVIISPEIDDDVPEIIGIDELRLYQVISNIYFNSLKYTPMGKISIIVSMVDGKLEIAIQDTGIGIPKDKINTIFEDYERLEGLTSTRYRGTGLGLTITKKLINVMGGCISVISTPGEGSTFTMIIPFTQVVVEEKEIKATVIEIPENYSGNILLVEDYPTNRMIAKSHLKATGYRVVEAENGEIALDLCKDIKFDLIIMDIQMPVLDGFNTTIRIRAEDSPNKNTPILAMTANGLKSIEDRCTNVGMNGIILKPIRKESFLKSVNTVLKSIGVV
jgi:signal transduction histidine kinase/CheY-like chemotaxis protein